MRRALPWLTAISLIACVVLACLYVKELQKVAVDRASESTDLRQIAALKQELSSLNEATGKGQSRQPTEKPPAAHESSVIHQSDVAREFPEYATIWQKRVRRMVMSQWGDALAALNLPPGQLAQLKNLLIARFTSGADAREAARDAGLQPDNPAYAAALKQANDNVEQQITALIGPEAKAKLDYGQGITVFKGEVTTTYGPDFADAGVPMSPDQSLAMAQALKTIRSKAETPITFTPEGDTPDPSTGLSPVDDLFLAKAAQILSSAQLEIVKNRQIESHRSRAIEDQYRRLHHRDDYPQIGF